MPRKGDKSHHCVDCVRLNGTSKKTKKMGFCDEHHTNCVQGCDWFYLKRERCELCEGANKRKANAESKKRDKKRDEDAKRKQEEAGDAGHAAKSAKNAKKSRASASKG